MEESQATQQTQHQSGKAKTAAIIILSVVLVALGCFTAITLINQPAATKCKDAPEAVSQNTFSQDDYLEIQRLTNLILFQRNSTDQFSAGFTPNFESLASLQNLSETAKATIANHYTAEEFPGSDKWQSLTKEEHSALLNALGLDTTDNSDTMDFYSIYHNYDITKTAEAYKKIFGTELDLSQKFIRLDYAMPGIDYIYLPETKALYTGAGGGDILTAKYTYINSIKFDNNKAYANFNMFESQYPMDEITYSDSETCYDDIERSHAVSCNLYLPEGINSENYETLKPYRLVFEKNDEGNYVYKTTEAL